jgi:hypothetical protein
MPTYRVLADHYTFPLHPPDTLVAPGLGLETRFVAFLKPAAGILIRSGRSHGNK